MGTTNEGTTVICPKCGEPMERTLMVSAFDGTDNQMPIKIGIMCKCKKAEKEATDKRLEFEEHQRQVNTLKDLSLMDAKMAEATFKNFKANEFNEKLGRIGCNYIRKFPEMKERGQGIIFWGNVGTGKSYTAACIANYLLEHQHTVVMTSFVKIINKLMTFDEDSKNYAERLNQAELLIIDDLGTERATDYSLERVYDIVDSRYRAKLPMILTTNLSVDDMRDRSDVRYSRIFDRIFEMCYPVEVIGPSWREHEAYDRYNEVKKMLEG